LLAEASAANRQVREWQAQCEQTQAALNRALTDGARAAVELTHAEALSRQLQTTAATQGDELATAQQRDALSVNLAKLAAQFEAQQQLLADYRARLGIDSHSAESARFRMKRTRFGENMFSYPFDFKGNIKANRQILHEKDDYPLKAAHPKTRERYREVCALLFFRHGITPTANRRYQLVRRGSMSTPTAVLGEFWAELREKSRARIEHPDLPADLGAAAGELVSTLWTRATASAEAALDALRGEVEAQRAEAQHSVVAARDELGCVGTVLEQRTAALLAAQIEIRDLEKTQAEGHAQRQALEAELARIKAALAARSRARGGKRRVFARAGEAAGSG
jgi:hypothetical protein